MVTDLYMPAEGTPMPLPESKALTILLSEDDGIYYYNGNWEKAVKENGIYKSGFSYGSGIGKVIRDKQEMLESADTKEGKRGLMLIIKSNEKASYKNLVNILDEILINDVKKYALVKLTKPEINYLDRINTQ